MRGRQRAPQAWPKRKRKADRAAPSSGRPSGWRDAPVKCSPRVYPVGRKSAPLAVSHSRIRQQHAHSAMGAQRRAGASHLLPQQQLELCLAVVQPRAVGGIHHPDEPVRLLKVVAPVRAEGRLATHIPNVELEAAVPGRGWGLSSCGAGRQAAPSVACVRARTHSSVLMLKPRVGAIVSTSSPLNFLTMVVLPALSRPSISRRISFSFSFCFFSMVRRPMVLGPAAAS